MQLAIWIKESFSTGSVPDMTNNESKYTYICSYFTYASVLTTYLCGKDKAHPNVRT